MSRHVWMVHCTYCTEEDTHWKDVCKRIGVDSRQLYRYNPHLWEEYTQGTVTSGTLLYVPNANHEQSSSFELDLPLHATGHMEVYTATLCHLDAILSLTEACPIRAEMRTWIPPGTTSHTGEAFLMKDTSLLDIVRSPVSDTDALCADPNLTSEQAYVKRKCQQTKDTRDDPMMLTNIDYDKQGALHAKGYIRHATTGAAGGTYAKLQKVLLRTGTRIPQHTNNLALQHKPPRITDLHPDHGHSSWTPVVVDQCQYRVYDSLPNRLVLERKSELTVVGLHTTCDMTIDNQQYTVSFDTLWYALDHVYVTSDPSLPYVEHANATASQIDDDDLDDLSYLLAEPHNASTHASNVPSSPNVE